jgi:hypothetical protein
VIDGWTDPKQQSVWGFMLITSLCEEYLYSLQNYSSDRHTTEFLTNKIDEIIKKIGVNKIGAIVSDNASNIAAAREAIVLKYPNIINLRCIAHCFNLIF